MRFPKRSETKTRIAHALAGVTICVEGWERIEDGHAVGGGALALLGIGLLLLARFHTKLHGSLFAMHLDSAAFAAEGTVMGIIAFLYFERGKHALPWCYVIVMCAYLFLAILRRGRQPAEHHVTHQWP